MAQPRTPSFPCFSVFMLLFLCFSSVGFLNLVSAEKTWCVAKPSSDDNVLKENIQYACSHVKCNFLRKGLPCSEPDTLINQASVAMNLYYQANGRNTWNCDFKNSSLTVITDPSYEGCIYAYGPKTV